MLGKQTIKEHAGEICPIYIMHTDKEIVCKSYIMDADSTALRYTSRRDMEQQHNIYCCENYRYCEQYLSYRHFRWEDD